MKVIRLKDNEEKFIIRGVWCNSSFIDRGVTLA